VRMLDFAAALATLLKARAGTMPTLRVIVREYQRLIK